MSFFVDDKPKLNRIRKRKVYSINEPIYI